MRRFGRREFMQVALAGGWGLAASARAFGQARGGAPARVAATPFSDRIVALSGAGGNIAVVIGPDGLLMVDGGLANRTMDVAAAVTAISPRMVQVLFNTHYHFDHVGSNERLGRGGTRIIAHQKVKDRLVLRFENPAMGRTMEPLEDAGLPVETFTTGGRLVFGAETLEYTHVPDAHTDGDAWVFFPEANVLHTGDLFWTGRYPVIDYTVGGSLARMAEAIGALDRVGDERTRLIPGHGAPDATKTQMRAVREAWLTINARIEGHVRAGRTLAEVLVAAPTREFDARFGVMDPRPFLQQAYGGALASLPVR